MIWSYGLVNMKIFLSIARVINSVLSIIMVRNFENRVYGQNVKTVTQLWETYPALEPYYHDFEKNFDGDLTSAYMYDYQGVVYGLVVLYVVLVFMVKADKSKFSFVKVTIDKKTGKKTRDTPGWLRHSFGLWNLGLSLFSFYGVSRTVPQLLHYISTMSFHDTVCTAPTVSYGHGVCGLAVQLFIFSKIPELLDTLFLALKGADIGLLQWYHHSTVLAFCWHSYITESGYGLYFVSMNYSVHAVMYMYFFLMNYKFTVITAIAPFITFIQIAQMVIGTGVVASTIYYRIVLDETTCENDVGNLYFGGIIYFSYLCLFVDFAIRKYALTPAPKKKTA